jgi:hypothetical protein
MGEWRPKHVEALTLNKNKLRKVYHVCVDSLMHMMHGQQNVKLIISSQEKLTQYVGCGILFFEVYFSRLQFLLKYN